MKKNIYKIILTVLVLTVFGVDVSAIAKASSKGNGIDYKQAYQSAKRNKVIDGRQTSFAEFKKVCDKKVVPSFRRFKKEGGNLAFVKYAKGNDFGYAPVLNGTTTEISYKVHSEKYQHYKLKRKSIKGYHMKAGDILICYGSNPVGTFVGHAAIAKDSKRILHTPGGLGAQHNAKSWTKHHFFHKYVNKKHGKYVLIYRITRHQKFARAAAKYAYNHYYRYKKNNPNYFTTSRLYDKDPTYCSKYVYLSYYYGNKHHLKGLKHNGNMAWVFPHTLVKVFKGSYHPKCIHKIV